MGSWQNIVAYIDLEAGFGEVGAVLVENEHLTEMHVIDVVLERFTELSHTKDDVDPIVISCNSWVQSSDPEWLCREGLAPEQRVFFAKKSYLPMDTPVGLRRLRTFELEILRGDTRRREERKPYDRIYDYDIYNDLDDLAGVIGDDPERNPNYRPPLGGPKHPYPRRCKTGFFINRKGGFLERVFRDAVYVPRDEAFSELKSEEFGFRLLFTTLHKVIPPLVTKFNDPNKRFPFMTAINMLFNEGVKCSEIVKHGFWRDLLARFIRRTSDAAENVFRFNLPQTFERDGFSWFKDEEFARQTVAGINPLRIKLVTEPELEKSDLTDKQLRKSHLTDKLLDDELKRRHNITLKEALDRKRLFIIDYHDVFMKYAARVSEISGRFLYGSRTLFINDEGNTLKPVAIELSRPAIKDFPEPYRKVFMPRNEATKGWLWKLAKAHVLAHDSSYHQLISHWLRAHCCMEPYIIAANRQLSAMHPIYRLLHPHFRYTMEINALARLALINVGGVIESTFSPEKYSLEMSSYIYDKEWRFDREALPDDLLHRGMAVEDSSAESGVRLVIEDYPYAMDGLDLWCCIKKWVTQYVNHYYKDPGLVVTDEELQGWWKEVKTKGHPDKKEGWINLSNPEDLIKIVSTIIWVASGHHAAVNFGQYAYAGYFPNRPTITRTKMPSEYIYTDPDNWDKFIASPVTTLLECFPSMQQAAKVMALLDVLSSHSSKEEYIGQNIEPSWKAEEAIRIAFSEFHAGLDKLDHDITYRNGKDKNLKHRYGAGVLPYDLLRPKSDVGVTGKGVPNSISI
ncbi:linoleate 13S-lipoxygenase 2-1, chloroplastic-like [Chenopodium quinoa]|uniref:linoleate 13S-lipoxygenase 2-1, chloroplastic-like n=1 Tax=Chenopodium quinoa TaxID=63459 RepID=UPI000B779167|nr:linoleate 13S-lipoxygenase 2-1, chloroplastic-like [Chenopodium quinoa]